jgi:heme A synthase
MRLTKFSVFTWTVLFLNVLVILWGAYVRATGSGAGCGSHWPLCNGEVLPRAAQIETLVEFTHRITSGLAFILVVIMFIGAFRLFPKGHIVRRGAAFSMFFIVTEALVGAGLVLFGWVADDESIGRVYSISIHLINTFLLLAFLTLTSWWASGGERPHFHGQTLTVLGFLAGYFGLLLLGVSGAITALGDTLFPAASLAEGVQQDFSSSAHFLIRLRIWHPVIAVTLSFYIFLLAGLIGMFTANRMVKRLALALGIVFLLQLMIGLANLLLLAPVWLQLVHLLAADTVWIIYVVLSVATLGVNEQPNRVEASSAPNLLSKINNQAKAG